MKYIEFIICGAILLSGCAYISPSLEFTSGSHELEYGHSVSDKDLKKFVKSVQGDLTIDSSDLNTQKVGTYKVDYTAEKLGQEVTRTLKVEVTDTAKPKIKFKKTLIESTVGEDVDIEGNVKSVTDSVDGDLVKADELKKGTYTIDSSQVNTKKVGSYTVTVKAEDQNSNVTTRTFRVRIKDNAAIRPVITLNGSSMTVAKGEDADLNSNVSSVVDPVDGTLTYKNVQTDYDTAARVTENKSLLEQAGGQPFYTILTKNLNTDKTGNYKAMVVAVNSLGHESIQEFTVTVQEEFELKDVLSNPDKYANKLIVVKGKFPSGIKTASDKKMKTTDGSGEVTVSGATINDENCSVKATGVLKKVDDNWVFVIQKYEVV
ncbi:hypothetical protein [Catenisphaera adipataccumulans]|uniref:Nucleoid DNA-binding protein n=1 Tax=Catenisphaera adipataccumulans TaxID=700500 RepID=A0A7W8CX24_9FIRM|nr:hypothetical protein [Catenisphaera adipataccumulans]MBB5182058.1 nucleoid DNA-binding protein [Catenisphaera adipataccumulans]